MTNDFFVIFYLGRLQRMTLKTSNMNVFKLIPYSFIKYIFYFHIFKNKVVPITSLSDLLFFVKFELVTNFSNRFKLTFACTESLRILCGVQFLGVFLLQKSEYHFSNKIFSIICKVLRKLRKVLDKIYKIEYHPNLTKNK